MDFDPNVKFLSGRDSGIDDFSFWVFIYYA